jgi:DNA-binding NtrC family response regulator
MTRVLLVDDDAPLRLALGKALTRKGLEVVDVASSEAALEPLKTGSFGGVPVDVCVLDLRMPGLSGLEVLRRTLGRRVPVVVLTGHGTVPDAVEAMRLGAANFMQKPVDADELVPVLKQAERVEPSAIADAMLGASPPVLALLDKLNRVSEAEDPLLFVGEHGSGKEIAARRVHELSTRRRNPFVTLYVAAQPRDAVEAELFGSRKGGLMGGDGREGLLARAGEGTLFIDDVADLPLDVQARLVRAFEERRYRAVGGDVDRPVKARIVCATQRDLKSLVEQGRFRADLLYVLGIGPLHLPPLRDRGDDVILIARAWLGRAVAERPAGRDVDTTELSFSPDAEERLREHAWPGNVRELVNIVKRAALFTAGNVVDAELVAELLAESPYAHGVAPPVSPPASSGEGPRAGQRVTLEELEKTHIRRLLDELNNVSEVARIVGIDRRTLQRKMIAWGFRDPRPADNDIDQPA